MSILWSFYPQKGAKQVKVKMIVPKLQNEIGILLSQNYSTQIASYKYFRILQLDIKLW